MKITLSISFVLFLADAAAFAQKPSDTPYRSEEAKYAIRFPKEPTIANKELATSAGVLKVQTTKYEGNGVVFSVSTTVYPASFGEVDPVKILDGVRDGLKGADGEIKSDKATIAGEEKHPARDVRVEAGKNAVRAKLVLVDRRLIQIMVVGGKDAVDTTLVTDFFKSFELTK